MTIALDRAVGIVLDSLKKEGVHDNTIVFFLNDNGGASGHDNSPLRGQKGSSWEGGFSVPFAVQWPGVIPAGKTVTHPVISLDLFATSMAAAGIEKSPGKPLDGVDLVPFLTGEREGRPHQTLSWKNGTNWAVRDGDLKLVVGDASSDKPALFDLAQDRSKTKNLADEKPAEVKRLTALYEAWKATHQPTPWAGKRGKDDSED